MKKYIIMATILVVVAGIFTGCFGRRQSAARVEYRETSNAQYSTPSEEYYWVHDGRVYQRDTPGNYYIFDGGRRGNHIQDRNYTVRIEREGKRFRNYNEANEHLRHNRGNQRHNQYDHGHR